MPNLGGPVHITTLKRMAQSPAHYRHAILHPAEPTDAMLRGTMTHAYTLGGVKPIAIYDGRRQGKDWDAFQNAHRGQEIIRAVDAAAARNIANAVLTDERALDLLRRAPIREREILFDIGGRACSVRPDAYGDEIVVELKVTNCADPNRFWRHAVNMGYFAQLSWQQDAIERAFGFRPERAFIIAVEDSDPYVVQPYEIDANGLEFGRKQWRTWWERLMVCEAANQWPGYSSCIEPLCAPEWADKFELVIDGEEVGL